MLASGRAGVPLYRRIAATLARELENGQPASGQPLPSEAALGQRFGVSRITIRQALAILESQGLIFRQQGRGTYASPPKLVRHLYPLVTFEEDMALQRVSLVTELDEFRSAAPPIWALERFGAQAGRRLARLVLRRVVGGLCVCHDERYLSRSVTKDLTPAGLVERSTRDLLREKSGILLTYLGHETEVVRAGEAVARAMGISPGTLVLQNTYTSYADGVPVEVGRASYRADRFRFSFGERQWQS